MPTSSPSVTEPDGFTIFPFLPLLAPHAGLYRQLFRQSMILLVLPFLPLFPILLRQSMNLLDLPFYRFLLLLAPLQVYTAN